MAFATELHLNTLSSAWSAGMTADAVVESDGPESLAVESDGALIARFQNGDEGAFRLLYERHRSSLFRFVRRMAPGTTDAEEIVQETWFALIHAKARYKPTARFSTYLYSIAHRKTVDRWRRRGRQAEFESVDLDTLEAVAADEPATAYVNSELGKAITVAVMSLPMPQREAFLLRAEAGLSVEEIAQVTSAEIETAKSRLRYATVKLRAALSEWSP
jgi:RNA polymerase sigma-70 factor, ECF subfamily